MFILTCSSAFAQKNELKNLEKFINKNNTAEASVLLTTIEQMLPQATDEQKAAYYFFKAKNLINLANNGIDLNENRTKAIETINQLIKFENDTKTKKYATEVSELKNNLLATLVNEAISYNQDKKYINSSRLFEQAYKLNPSDTIYLYNAANDAINAKDFDFAENKLKDLISLNFNGKSETYTATSETSGKVESFGIDKKARDLAVRNGTHTSAKTITSESVKPLIYNNLTNILLNKENYSEAENYALKAYELDKSNINSLLNVLLLYYNTNRYYKFAHYSKKGLEQFPENELLLYNLALIKIKNDQNDQAIEYLNTILKINNNHFDALKSLGNIELQKDAEITNKINALPNKNSSVKTRNSLLQEKKLIYNNALSHYLKAQSINDKDESLNELILQLQDFLTKN